MAKKKDQKRKSKVSKKANPKKKPAVKRTVKKSAAKKSSAKKSKPVKVKKVLRVVEPEKIEKLVVRKTKDKPAKVTEVKQIKKEEPKVTIPSGPVYVKVDSNAIKGRVKTILISQPKPESDKNPYLELARKHNLKIDFRQFIKIEPVPARDFRQQKVSILDHNAVILTSRLAVDHYFRMCNEMRITVPESMKYFCISESTAYYLQKYVQYRKRKIFHGHQTIGDLVDVIKKHKEEKFLLPVSDVHKEQIVDLLDALNINYTKAIFYRTVSADLADFDGQLQYDVVVFFTPAGIRSLKKNFPKLNQTNLRLAAFGANTCQEVRAQGFRLDIAAPTPETPSMTMAIDAYIRENNKR